MSDRMKSWGQLFMDAVRLVEEEGKENPSRKPLSDFSSKELLRFIEEEEDEEE